METVTITAMEYRELVLKAYKYDKLREMCALRSYTTTEEDILFDLTEEEKEFMKERRNK